jgi:hypothetical protein
MPTILTSQHTKPCPVPASIVRGCQRLEFLRDGKVLVVG